MFFLLIKEKLIQADSPLGKLNCSKCYTIFCFLPAKRLTFRGRSRERNGIKRTIKSKSGKRTLANHSIASGNGRRSGIPKAICKSHFTYVYNVYNQLLDSRS